MISRIKYVFIVFLALSFFVSTYPKLSFAASSPDLGEAKSFAVLGGTAVTNVPTSIVTGDVGLSPAAGSYYSGLNTSEVTGTIFAPDSSGPDGTIGNDPTMLSLAKSDLVTAYNALALGSNSDANCEVGYQFGSGNVDLSGQSLAPGVYCADTFTLSGTLTLTGSGVWVFRSAATLVTSGTANIVGGNACNVWWQIPSSATLGTNTSLIGNILALTSISMNTGATLSGRALARNGAVSLQSNSINQSCSSLKSPLSVAGTVNSYCPPLDNNIVKPILISSKRIDSDSISLNWGPYSGTEEFNIQYAITNGDWQYNTNVVGFSTTINNLPLNQPVWVRIAARNNCTIGDYGTSKLIGGPGLPNAGKLHNFVLNQNLFNSYLLKWQ